LVVLIIVAVTLVGTPSLNSYCAYTGKTSFACRNFGFCAPIWICHMEELVDIFQKTLKDISYTPTLRNNMALLMIHKDRLNNIADLLTKNLHKGEMVRQGTMKIQDLLTKARNLEGLYITTGKTYRDGMDLCARALNHVASTLDLVEQRLEKGIAVQWHDDEPHVGPMRIQAINELISAKKELGKARDKAHEAAEYTSNHIADCIRVETTWKDIDSAVKKEKYRIEHAGPGKTIMEQKEDAQYVTKFATASALAGAYIGSVVPVAGTLVGAFLGGVVGMIYSGIEVAADQAEHRNNDIMELPLLVEMSEGDVLRSIEEHQDMSKELENWIKELGDNLENLEEALKQRSDDVVKPNVMSKNLVKELSNNIQDLRKRILDLIDDSRWSKVTNENTPALEIKN